MSQRFIPSSTTYQAYPGFVAKHDHSLSQSPYKYAVKGKINGKEMMMVLNKN